MSYHFKKILLIACMPAMLVDAAPLDDQIAAFKEAGTQTEKAVAQILKSGLKEQRSATAFAAAKPWLSANPSLSQEVMFLSAQSAEFSGDLTAAVSFYRKLLSLKDLDAKRGEVAVPSCYRLLINLLGDSNSAYLLMRDKGDGLRKFGDARKYDRWFLGQAKSRNHITAVSSRLIAIGDDKASDIESYEDYVRWVVKQVETYSFEGDELHKAARDLAALQSLNPVYKARLLWASEVVEYNRRLDLARNSKMEVRDGVVDAALQAASNLIKVSPDHGPMLVAKGWGMEYDHGNSGNCVKRFEKHGERKLAQLLSAVPMMSPDKRDDLLAYPLARGRIKYEPNEIYKLMLKYPEMLNNLRAANVSLFNKSLTQEQAKVLAPLLARNPHGDAALIRAFAAAGEMKVSALAAPLAKKELWRFENTKAAANHMWNSGLERDVKQENQLDKLLTEAASKNDNIARQITKSASSKDRLSAFNSLRKDLLSKNPSIPHAYPKWADLFKQAPSEDLVKMIRQLLGDLNGDAEHLLRIALNNARFGKNGNGRLPWQAHIQINHFKHHQKDTRKDGVELVKVLASMVEKQMKSGEMNEAVFGMWLHVVDVKDKEVRDLMRQVVESSAYPKLGHDYRIVAMDEFHFGVLAMPSDRKARQTDIVSRELRSLPDGAKPADVLKAFDVVIERVEKSATPVKVSDLQPLAALPDKWSDATLAKSLSLFRDNAPLGTYPTRRGYEQLIMRITKEVEERKQWGMIEPYAAGLWHAAQSTDDQNHYRGAAALSRLAESAAKAGVPSIAMSLARSGQNSAAVKAMRGSSQEAPREIVARLRQVGGEAAVEVGAVEIPVDETHPAYSIYKSNVEFAQGNLDSAWNLYLSHEEQLGEVLRQLSVEYAMWLLQRNIETNRTGQAEDLVKNLTIWSRQVEGTFSIEQDGQLKIYYADLAFRKGVLPTARALYRGVADTAAYKGTRLHLEAALGSVMVDRVSRNFGAAMAELDKLMLLKNPDFRTRVRYARAEVLMDQESFAEALEELEAVLRQESKHPDALILRGKIQYEMRKLVEASEIELGPTQDNTVIVPGETVKINLRDPTLQVSGVGSDIEVEIWAKSGDKERVLLYQLGDSKEKFRAEVPTALGPANPGDKVLQILGEDEIRFGYSKRFRDKMDDLPADPEIVISVASDAYLSFSAGAFPPREGERRLNIEELGLSSAQAALGTRAVRPGNPVYIRVTDLDQSQTANIDEINVALQSSSGDVIRRLILKETRPFSGEFEGVVPTSGAQALAFASESAPGRDPNMSISSKDYPGWQGEVGEKVEGRTFGVDLNDNAALGTMTVDMGGSQHGLTHFALQTSMNGKEWTTRHRYPDNEAPWNGRPRVASFPTYRGGKQVAMAKDYHLPKEWERVMELESVSPAINYSASHVGNISVEKLPMVSTGHPGYPGLLQFRALFYQPAAAIRTFKLTGYPNNREPGKINTIFLIDGEPAALDSDDPMTITRELKPGLHEIQVWRNESRNDLLKRKPVILCDKPSQNELVACPDAMFDPAGFPEGVRKHIAMPASVTSGAAGNLEIQFAEGTRARMVRFVIFGYQGVAPQIKKIALNSTDGTPILPVEQDYKALRENEQLEVLPGDTITVRYEDPVSATPKRDRHEGRLSVAFNNATITASFLNYEFNKEGERELVLEPIRRFRFDDAVGIVVDDADLDISSKRDVIDVAVATSDGQNLTIKAVETEEHSGQFIGNVFPVEGKPSRRTEIQMPPGGSLTATYRDVENLDPGIPADRVVQISHAQYATPVVDAFTVSSVEASQPLVKSEDKEKSKTRRGVGPEWFRIRRKLDYHYLAEKSAAESNKVALIGAPLCFDVVAPHLALARSSEIRAYVQTEAARKAADADGAAFDVRVPGTLKLLGMLKRPKVEVPQSYSLIGGPKAPTNEPPLEEGRFSFSVPLILADPPNRSFAVKSADDLPSSALPDGLAVKAGDVIHVGFPWQDGNDKVQWKTMSYMVGANAFLEVMENGYSEPLFDAFVGEKVYLRLIAPGLDQGPARDVSTVTLKGTSGASADYELKETESHSGIFKGVFSVSYADEKIPSKLPPIALNGFPVRYGDSIEISYMDQSFSVSVNKGADGLIEPFSKRFTGDEMAVRTSFTLAECYFELAKKHREMEQESLARREIGHARKLLAEALANHKDDELKAHAEYLLGNLSQEFADLAKNEEAKIPMYQDALSRFSKIPTDYPDTEFASKAQFKTALVYEKMGEIENSVEEYVKLAYKYPNDELIPTVMSRLGGYFQARGMVHKKKADPYREKDDDASFAQVLKFDELSYPEFLNAAMVFSKLQERFPDDPLAGLAGLRAGQNYMRAHQYEKAINAFDNVTENEDYDGREIRSQALYWKGLCYERLPHRPDRNQAYEIYRRVTFDFPDSKWAKYARGRLADPSFEDIIAREKLMRERMIEALKEQSK